MRPAFRFSRWFPVAFGLGILLSSFAFITPPGHAEETREICGDGICTEKEDQLSCNLCGDSADTRCGCVKQCPTDCGTANPPSPLPPPPPPSGFVCPSDRDLDEQKINCERSGGLPGKVRDESGCAIVRCEKRVCPLEADIDRKRQACRSEGGETEDVKENGCTVIRCRTKKPEPIRECASSEALNRNIAACKEKGLNYTHVYDGRCRRVECREWPQNCTGSNDLLEQMRRCESDGLAHEIGFEKECKVVRCVPKKACTNEEDLEMIEERCKEKGLETLAWEDRAGCRRMACKEPPPGTENCPTPEEREKKAERCRSDGGEVTEEETGICTRVFCKKRGERCELLHVHYEKIAGEPRLSEEAAKIRMEYDRECAQKEERSHPDSCRDLTMVLEKLREHIGTPDYQRIADERAEVCKSSEFEPESGECKTLRSQLVRMSNAGDSESEDFASLKEQFLEKCETANEVPPAGYEDEVLTDPEAFKNPFPDTDITTEEGKAAAELYRRGVIGGFPDGTFRGSRELNRAETAKFLLKACNLPTEVAESGVSRLHDVLENQWYTPFVKAAFAQGIIKGHPDGTFRPADSVQRDAFTAMLARACELATDQPYTAGDVPGNSWFAPYAGIAERYGLFDAPEGFLEPGERLTRSDAAIAIYRFLGKR